MRFPRMTIVTPNYNQAKYLQATIDSVLSQNYPDLQYIIIDGGSTDGSLDIINRHAHHLDYWISEKDSGQSEALNKGFARAPHPSHHVPDSKSNHLFAFLNSDDLYAPGALRKIAEAYAEARTPKSDPDQTWLVGNVDNFGDAVNTFSTIYPSETSDLDRYFWFYANPVHQPGSFWSAHLFRRFGPFNTTLQFVFDYDFFMKLRFLANVRPIHVPHTLAYFRLHHNSKTVANQHLFEPEFQRVRSRITDMLTASEQQAMHRYVRQTKASRLQVSALDEIRQGNRTIALSKLVRSFWHDPRLLWQRRTAGTIKRLVSPT